LTFQDFNFDEKLLEGLYSMGYSKPTPIQAEAIPLIQTNRDLIACAQTGTGKTAAFLLPIINKIISLPDKQRRLNTLIISPTRELATQIDNQVEGLGYFTGISSISIYGGGDGNAWNQQKKALEEGAEIIIATPGRLMAILQMGGTIDFSNLQHLILDEADRMLDMGFFDDIIKIIKYIPAKRQTLLFSATMPPKIRKLAHSILTNPEQLNIAISKPSEGILQQAYLVYDTQKINLLTNILKSQNWGPVIIFASTKESVKKLDVELRRTGLKIKAFHSDLEQKEREQIMIEFKSKSLQILIGTDILSRGIDVEGISLVINYTVPHDPEDYIHRIGRTARAETTGTAITFINDKDQRKFADIEDLIEREIPKLSLPAGMGDAPVYQPNKRVSSGVAGKGNFKKKPYHQKKGFVKK
jgi:ATP-dependent RNA helicase RhlE